MLDAKAALEKFDTVKPIIIKDKISITSNRAKISIIEIIIIEKRELLINKMRGSMEVN